MEKLPFHVNYLPDQHLFLAPQARSIQDLKTSRLDLWKANYISMCKGSNMLPKWSVLEGIDLFLDRKVLVIFFLGRKIQFREKKTNFATFFSFQLLVWNAHSVFFFKFCQGVVKEEKMESLELSDVTVDDLTLLCESLSQTFAYK